MGDEQEKNQQSRLIKVPGVSNFRDLGGYAAEQGRIVKWGVLYRSGHLADLTSRGLKQLAVIDPFAVVDFRSAYEVERRPDNLPGGMNRIHLPIMDEANREISQEIRQRIRSNQLDGFDPDRLIKKAYRQFAKEFTPEFRTFFHTIREAEGRPVLWHCTAGKDRTGFAAAVLLQILGVNRDTVLEDYLLSNRHVNRINKYLIRAVLARGIKAYRMIEPLMGVQADWLDTAMSAIDDEWGDFPTYLEGGLDLNQRDIRVIKSSLLQ